MFEEMEGSIIKTESKNGKGCSGLLVAANDKFLKIRLLNGKEMILAIDSLTSITKTKNQMSTVSMWNE